MIIAIDGTGGAGKSTVSRLLAERLGFACLNTGELYRRVARECLRLGLDPGDPDSAARAARRSDFASPPEGLRSEAVSRAVAEVAKVPEVREIVRARQREFAAGRDAVVEGRDIGTVVFPEAELKLFVTASLEERARRRAAQLAALGEPADEAEVRASIEARDRADATREESPLVPAPDAILVSTDGKSVEKTVDRAFAEYLRVLRSARGRRTVTS